jgi:hypothetical protein
MASVRIPGFSPAAYGLPYANAWPHIPLLELQLGTLARLSIGDAANGLCGGMSFTAADLHAAGVRPGDAARPEAGTARFDYIVARQMDSFAGVAVPLRFYSLMRTVRPEREPLWADVLGSFGIDRHSRGWVMVRQEWPRVRADLDAGRLAMIGLLSVVDDDPFRMNRNHQVVAYGYDLEGNDLTLWIYDSNWPKDDEVTLRLDIGDPRAPVTTTWSRADRQVVCFFRAPYASRDPLPWR